MKKYILCLSIFAACFLIYSAEDTVNKELAYINNLIARAKQFEVIIGGGDYAKIPLLFPSKENEEREIIFWIRDCTEGNKIAQEKHLTKIKPDDIPNYYITVHDRRYGSKGSNNVIDFRFYNAPKNGSTKSKVFMDYSERGSMLDLVSSYMELRRDGTPYFCDITVELAKLEYGTEYPARIARVEWDERGKITKQENLHYMQERNLNVKFPKVEFGNEPPKLLPKKKYSFPKSEHKEVTDVFKRLKKLYTTQRVEELGEVLHWELMDPKALTLIGSLYLAPKNVCIAFTAQMENENGKGYMLSMDDKGTLISYAEGSFVTDENVKQIKEQKGLGAFADWLGIIREPVYWTKDLSEHIQNGVYWSFDYPIRILRGVEVKYHNSGQPKSYRTFVREDRLFGRQIEWDDNGKVIFDIDLDIPSADIPAEVKNTAKAEAKSATETKSAATPPLPVSAEQNSATSALEIVSIISFVAGIIISAAIFLALTAAAFVLVKSRK